MAKHLGDVLVIASPLVADRFDITSYAVDATGSLGLDIAYQCGRTNQDDTITVTAERVQHVAGGASLDAAMAEATANILRAVLTAAVQGQLLSADAAAGILSAVASNPTLARDAYYTGTRDALYRLL
jgi:hypothetical protein